MLLSFHTLRFLFGNRRGFARVLLGLLFLCINKLWYEKTIRFHHTTIYVPLYRHCIIVRSQFYRHSIVIISPSYHHYITIISYYIILYKSSYFNNVNTAWLRWPFTMLFQRNPLQVPGSSPSSAKCQQSFALQKGEDFALGRLCKSMNNGQIWHLCCLIVLTNHRNLL